MDYGEIRFHLDKLIEDRNLSKNKLSFRSELQRTQINRICSNNVSRVDLGTLARLCYVLDCEIGDLLEYIRPESEENNQKKEG